MLEPWARLTIVRAAIGAGCAAALALIVGAIVLFQSRPPSPKPWDTHAIRATFDGVGVNSSDHTLVFYYTLENETAHDYQLPDHFDVTLMSKLKEGTLSLDNPRFKGDDEFFLPAKQRVRFAVRSSWPCPDLSSSPPSAGALATYVNKVAPSLDGFVLFDQKNRYEVELPKGWTADTAALSK